MLIINDIKTFTAMKRLNQILTTFVLCIFVLLSIAGCDFLDLEPKATETRTATFTVAPKMVEFSVYSTLDPDWVYTYSCMILTNEKTNEVWAFPPDEIEDFKYTEGYKYKIKVQITIYKNTVVDFEETQITTPKGYMFPPVVSLSRESYKLINVLSKDKVDN